MGLRCVSGVPPSVGAVHAVRVAIAERVHYAVEVLVCVAGRCVYVVWRSFGSVESWLYIYLNTTYTFSAMAKILHSFPADFLSHFSL